MEPVILSCAELSTREINAALAALPDGASARILEPRGRHNLAVGLSNRVRIDIEGNAGYFTGGLGQGPDVVVDGFVGWSVGENLQAGSVRVKGNASECAGASSRGGTIVIEGGVRRLTEGAVTATVRRRLGRGAELELVTESP
jgi:formylmethanofuran dehydrogenase subunit C